MVHSKKKNQETTSILNKRAMAREAVVHSFFLHRLIVMHVHGYVCTCIYDICACTYIASYYI